MMPTVCSLSFISLSLCALGLLCVRQPEPKHSVNSAQMGFLQSKQRRLKYGGMYLKGVKCVTQVMLSQTQKTERFQVILKLDSPPSSPEVGPPAGQ